MAGISAAARRHSDEVYWKYARRGYGPGNTYQVRAWVIGRMRAEGATLAACAHLFGISTQLARHIANGRFPMYVSAEEREMIIEHRREHSGPG